MIAAQCPLCGGSEFGDYRSRKKVRCTACGSFERGRFLGLVLQRAAPAATGSPVVHFAPEVGTSKVLRSLYGEAYQPADVSPDSYPWMDIPVRQIDLQYPSRYLAPKVYWG